MSTLRDKTINLALSQSIPRIIVLRYHTQQHMLDENKSSVSVLIDLFFF